MTATDPVQAVALTLTEHRPRRADAFICTCGYVAGGFDDLTLHRSRAIVATARPLIEREAKAEAWDEGYRAACSDHRGYDSCATGDHGQQNVNPYREQGGDR